MTKQVKEKWIDVPTHSNYRVSSEGRIMNKKTGRVLKQCDNNSGYLTLNLYEKGNKTTIGAHRVVAEAFWGCDDETKEVDHIDGNKHNNRPENLEWVTRGENETRAYKNGLHRGPKHRPVRILETGETFGSIKDCARAIEGFDRNIKRCLDGVNKTYLGLTFEYADDADVNTLSANAISKQCVKRRPYKTSIRVVETGETFPSIRECARSIGGDQGTISACLAGRHKTHKGYHYEYVD